MKLKPLRKIPENKELLKYLPIWQNNNNNHLGIVDFCFRLFPNAFDIKYGVAPWAVNALKKVLYYEPNMTKEDRCHVIATFREGSKTTWYAYGFVLYVLLVGQYGIYWENNLLPEIDYIVYKCKTGREAKKRLLNVRVSLGSTEVTKLFGNVTPTFRQVRDKEAKDESNLLILPNKYILEAIGINQPIRGANIFNKRPKFALYDDPEHLENTKTQERRESNENDLLEETFGAVTDDGLLVYIGNKVHSDDLLGKLLVNNSWNKQFYQLSNYYTKNANEEEISAWAAKFSVKKIEKMRKWYESHPRLGIKAFQKNYYNIIRADTDYKVKYHNGKYFRDKGINWIEYDTPSGKKIENIYVTVGNDPAISSAKKSSDAVVSVVGITPSHKRFVLEQMGGKLDLHDSYYEQYNPVYPLAIDPVDIAKIKKRGSCEEITRMCIKYKADNVVIETAGQQRVFFIETKHKLEEVGIYIPMIDSVPNEEKIAKLKEGVLIYFEQGLYYMRDYMNELSNEVITFPYSKLDRLDSLYLCEVGLRAPKKLDYHPLKDDYISTEYNKSIVSAQSEGWIVL